MVHASDLGRFRQIDVFPRPLSRPRPRSRSRSETERTIVVLEIFYLYVCSFVGAVLLFVYMFMLPRQLTALYLRHTY